MHTNQRPLRSLRPPRSTCQQAGKERQRQDRPRVDGFSPPPTDFRAFLSFPSSVSIPVHYPAPFPSGPSFSLRVAPFLAPSLVGAGEGGTTSALCPVCLPLTRHSLNQSNQSIRFLPEASLQIPIGIHSLFRPAGQDRPPFSSLLAQTANSGKRGQNIHKINPWIRSLIPLASNSDPTTNGSG